MVYFDLDPGTELTEEERAMLVEAAKHPVIYDEDSPELTAEMEEGFRRVRKEKPHQSVVTKAG